VRSFIMTGPEANAGKEPEATEARLEGETLLHAAVREGTVEAVVSLLQQGADPNAGAQEKPLDIAVATGQVEKVRALLDRGARVRTSANPLLAAVGSGNAEVVQLLIDAGADVGGGDLIGKALTGHQDLLIMLLDAGAALHPDTMSGLGYLPSEAFERVYAKLKARGIDIDQRDWQGSTMLDNAAIWGNSGVVRFLVEKGAKVTTRALHAAGARGDEELFHYLLDHGASKRDRDWAGATLLHAVAAGGNPALVREVLPPRRLGGLLKPLGDVDVNAKDEDGLPPLYWAIGARWPCWDLALVALQKPPGDSTPEQRKQVVRYLIDHGARVDLLFADHPGELPLLDPLQITGDLARLDLLLEIAPRHVTAYSDDEGKTLLHHAAAREWMDGIRLLVEKGANINVRDSSDRTPLSYAVDAALRNLHAHRTPEQRKQVVRYLIDHGARVDLIFADYPEELHWSHPLLMMGDLVRLDLFLEIAPRHVTAYSDDRGKTLLHHAAEWGWVAPVRLLVEKGANVNARDSSDRTPLSYTTDESIIGYLKEFGAIE
jgi:ankyrin repeat protein